MAVHFVHVAKTGGTAVRYAIREARRENGGRLESPWGPVWAHDHRFGLWDLEPDDKAVLIFRDPVSRFVSGFNSRLRRGAPRYMLEWTRAERRAFEWFPTPHALADALARRRGVTRRRAEFAMRSIRHLKRPMTFWTGDPEYFRTHLHQVLYVARQETLDDDWETLKELLGLPRGQSLPADPVVAHRSPGGEDTAISERGVRALRRWFADDYELVEIGEALRQGVVPLPVRRGRLAARTVARRPAKVGTG